MSSGFPYFPQFKSEFGNKEFMIWATVSSQSCCCWLYRASPSLAAKNIINLISVLTIWWCPCVEFLLCCWKRVFVMTSVFPWWNFVSLFPASVCTPRPNFPVTPGISWLPTFTFQPPIMSRTSFLVLVLEGLIGLDRTVELQLLHHYWLGHRVGTVTLNCLPWKRTEIILSFLRLHRSAAFQTLWLTMMATPFLLRDSHSQ